MNTNKNSYTLIYMVVMIIIVSLLLSITSGALKGRQAANVELDKKRQILSSLSDVVTEGQDIAALYNQYIQAYVLLNEDGAVIDTINDFNYEAKKGEYPMYVAQVNGQTKYIIPMHGAGLWGAIWGYVALNDDKNTIDGVFFSHASETPGLGANIVTPKFRNQFVGKQFLKDGKFVSIAVEKAGQKAEGQDQVDAISGGTITSKGVESMLKNSVGAYAPFMENIATDNTVTNDMEETNDENE